MGFRSLARKSFGSGRSDQVNLSSVPQS